MNRTLKQFEREAKRWLFIVHRWFGIVLCAVIAMWFASGLVMVYVGYPKLTDAERLSHLPELDSSGCCVSLARAWESLPDDFHVASTKLSKFGNRHVYTFSSEQNEKIVAVDAESGERIRTITKADALRAAEDFSPGSRTEYRGLVHSDVWLQGRRSPHYPAHRVQTNDAAGNLLYVSSTTGEVVRDAPLLERRLNFVGAWLHWLYFIRDSDSLWRGVIIVLSLCGLLLVLSGAVAGIIRWRFRGTYSTGRKTPFREIHLRWHHVSGLAFALIALTWLFSGLMSIRPFNLPHSDAPPLDRKGFAVSSLDPDLFDLQVGEMLRGLPTDFDVREIEWRVTGGHPYLVAYDGRGNVRVRYASGDQQQLEELPDADLVAAAGKLIPGHRITEARRLKEYDFYYYKRASHTLFGGQARPLPVIKVTFDDKDESIVYIDARTGHIVSHYNRADKQERWMFRLLHSWDFPGLLSVRPLWDIMMILLLGGGLALSITGSVLGWRSLRRTLKR